MSSNAAQRQIESAGRDYMMQADNIQSSMRLLPALCAYTCISISTDWRKIQLQNMWDRLKTYWNAECVCVVRIYGLVIYTDLNGDYIPYSMATALQRLYSVLSVLYEIEKKNRKAGRMEERKEKHLLFWRDPHCSVNEAEQNAVISQQK